MRRTLVTAFVIAMAPGFLAVTAHAQRKMQPLHTDPHVVAAEAGAGKAASAVDAGAAAADAGPPKFVETADQKKRRHDYSAKTGPIISSLIRANNKQVTQDERDAIKRHWGRAHLLWRIRAHAENEKDSGSVMRIDQLFAKMDTKFFERLKKLNDKAPVKGTDAGAK